MKKTGKQIAATLRYYILELIYKEGVRIIFKLKMSSQHFLNSVFDEKQL